MNWVEAVLQKPHWWRWLLICAAAYVGICVLLFVAQGRFIYLPSKARVELPPGFDEYRSSTGGIAGFRRVANHSECLFFFHGNGGNASAWAHAVAAFPGDIFVLEYPGYGDRGGTPTERSIKAAARELFEAEHSRYETIIVCGQSLGAAVSEAIFSQHPDKIDTLMLVTPFLSVAELARAHFAWIPTRWILRDKLELHDAWLMFPGKSVVVLAERDEIIPREQSLRFAAARDPRRKIIEMPGASHNTIDLDADFWEEILRGARARARANGKGGPRDRD
jgi:pimeloyl-ACP methyl ester carboxylesterase